MQIREYFLQARRRRGLSLQQLADALSLRFGRKLTRASLASWETGRVETPRREMSEAIQWQVDVWRKEDKAEGLPAPPSWVREWYSADYVCRGCEHLVPGPQGGAHYCLACGDRLPQRSCQYCGQVVEDTRFVHCPFCGKEFAGGGRL